MQRPCWTLNPATENIGRTYPQHQTMGAGYDYGAPDSVHKLPYDALPDFEPNFRTVMIAGLAKLTDLLSSAAIINTGYLVSNRLRLLLERFKLAQHRFYAVPMVHRQKPIEGYWWLQLPGPLLPAAGDVAPAEMEALIEADPSLRDVDLLRLYRPERFAYCFLSYSLRQAMIAEEITGVRFGTARIFR